MQHQTTLNDEPRLDQVLTTARFGELIANGDSIRLDTEMRL
jgi:hypothetical protein